MMQISRELFNIVYERTENLQPVFFLQEALCSGFGFGRRVQATREPDNLAGPRALCLQLLERLAPLLLRARA